jgi:hypothetical protein
MKKLLYILLFTNLTLSMVNAQTMMTIRNVYDFNVNDEFQTTLNTGTPNANRYKILSRLLSANNDTIFYTRSYNNYSSYPDYSTTPPHMVYTYSVGTDAIHYTNLDTLISAQYKNNPNDSCNSSKDTLYTSSQYCGVLVYQNITVRGTCFEPQTYTNVYGKGLGQVISDYNYPAGPAHNRTSLFYYKKGSVVCGSPDTTLASINKYELAQQNIHIYPNPAQNKITIDATDVIDIKLFDVIGKQITSTKENNIDVSNLPFGVYFIQVQTKQGTITQKIIVQH